MNCQDIEAFLTRAKAIQALVVGDLILDEYLWGTVERISPEAPVRVVDLAREELRLGGAGNVAHNLYALGCQVTLCGVIGADLTGTDVRRACSATGLADSALFTDPKRTTSRKTRVLAAYQQLVRIDRETREPLSRSTEEKVIEFIAKLGSECRVILVSDYLKGVLTEGILAGIMQVAGERKIPVVVGPRGADFNRYRGATLLVINRSEAEQAFGLSITDDQGLHRVAENLMHRINLEALLITHREQGMTLFRAGREAVHIPASVREVFDVTGAGDTVLAVMGLALAAGLDVAVAAHLANEAAGICVSKVGASTVSPQELIAAISSHPVSVPQ